MRDVLVYVDVRGAEGKFWFVTFFFKAFPIMFYKHCFQLPYFILLLLDVYVFLMKQDSLSNLLSDICNHKNRV